MKVYEVTYDHQWQGMNYGLFSTFEKAETFLIKHLRADLTLKKEWVRGFRYGDYSIEIKDVK